MAIVEQEVKNFMDCKASSVSHDDMNKLKMHYEQKL